jgi:hypothetical protein
MKKYIFIFYFLLIFYCVNAQVSDKVAVIGNEVTTNPAPSAFSQEVRFHVKWNASIGAPHIGSPGFGTYSGLMTIAPWSDGSGSKHHQINFNEAGLFWRKGAFGSSWGAWNRILTADEHGSVTIGPGHRPVIIKSNGLNGVWGSEIGFNAVLDTEAVPNTFKKLGGTYQYGGASIAVDYYGNMLFQMYNGQTESESVVSHNPQIVFKNNGNVGIGTTEPGTFKLAVDGKLGASEVVVTLARPWPDYVFDKEFVILPLSELAQYVKANKHLPDVPTAAEVRDNGVSLGEMNAILLKKVEELTLYLIEQQNEMVKMKSEIEILKNKQ